MHTPAHNPSGYENSSINEVEALGRNVRFLIMHGNADDNVHFQNTLVLIDKLDLANIDNYDMQVFPDSDHSIYFHNAHTVVYEREFFLSFTPLCSTSSNRSERARLTSTTGLSSWLINAFNGEWRRIASPQPTPI